MAAPATAMEREMVCLERLHKFMARHGVASRRACEEIIASGRVRVNGKTVNVPGTVINLARDRVEVDGKMLGKPERLVYILINKPRGYLSTARDPGGRKIVTDLLDGISERVFPVGRLDYDSEGLLLLTNDGDLTHRLTHPSHVIPKTYRVRVRGVPGSRVLEMLSRGVQLEDGLTAPAGIQFMEERDGNALLEMTLHEGRNRQIRRMFAKLGHEVIRLKRVRIGNLVLGNLRPGQYRLLRENEVRGLKKMAGTGIISRLAGNDRKSSLSGEQHTGINGGEGLAPMRILRKQPVSGKQHYVQGGRKRQPSAIRINGQFRPQRPDNHHGVPGVKP